MSICLHHPHLALRVEIAISRQRTVGVEVHIVYSFEILYILFSVSVSICM